MTSPLLLLSTLPGVEEAVEAARGAVDDVITDAALRRHGAEAALESSLQGARASAALDGVDIDLEFLRSGNVRLDHPGRAVAQAALRVAQEVTQLPQVWRRSPAQALARLHLVAAADEADPEAAATLGRPRTVMPRGYAGAPAVAEVAPRLEVLTRLVREDRTTPAIVVAAVVHGELLALRPFGTRDALVARAAERLVLRTRGLDPRGITVPEVGHAMQGSAAYSTCAEGFAEGTPEGVARWIIWCARAVGVGAGRAGQICRSFE